MWRDVLLRLTLILIFQVEYILLYILLFQNLDLTRYRLIYDGPMTLKLGDTRRFKTVDLHVLLLENCLMLLQKQVQIFKNHNLKFKKIYKMNIVNILSNFLGWKVYIKVSHLNWGWWRGWWTGQLRQVLSLTHHHFWQHADQGSGNR